MSIIEKINPNLAAFLDIVSFSDATYKGRQSKTDRGYDVVVGRTDLTS